MEVQNQRAGSTGPHRRAIVINIDVPRRLGGLILFYKRQNLFVRIGCFVSIFLVVFGLFTGLYQAYNVRPADYQITPAADKLLPQTMSLYAQSLNYYANNQDYEYNKGFQPPMGQDGQSSGPKFGAKFYSDINKGIDVTDSYNNVTLNITPRFSLAPPKKESNRLIYPIYGKDSQVVYSLGGGDVKENIVINKFVSNDMQFAYKLNLPDGTEARMEKDGSVGIYGVDSTLLGNVQTASAKDAELLQKARQNAKKTQLLFAIPAPFVAETSVVKSRAKSYFQLDKDTLILHVSGLKGAHYPLTIDPSVYITTASDFMRGNNESNIDFDVDDQLIQKGKTTGARFNSWTSSMDLNNARWNQGTVVAGGYIYVIGGTSGQSNVKRVYSTVGADTFVVPSGVTSITVKMWGGGGGGGGASSSSGSGGNGAGAGFVQATMTVTPSESLDVYVGGGGGGGTVSTSGQGGGGGGYSSIYRSSTVLALAAGGGGGGGARSTSSGAAGGAGGGTTGTAGSTAGGTAGGGGAGTPTTGGSAGTGGSNSGGAGSSLTGGAGGDARTGSGADGSANNGGQASGGSGGSIVSTSRSAGGGGGSGYFGGGGGSGSASTTGAGGGGGGSSRTDAGDTGVTDTGGSGINAGNNGDSDNSGAGAGGAGGSSSSAGTSGADGRIVISYTMGSATNTVQSTVYWAKFNTSNYTIESPNPGNGACSSWCTNSVYNLPAERAAFSLVAYNGFLYVLGGVNNSGTRQNTVYIAKLGANGEPSLWHPTDTNQADWVYWYQDTNLSSERSYSAAAVYNNHIYLLGGQTNATPGGVTTVEKADVKPTGALSAWSSTGTTALPSVGRFGLSVQIYNNHMYLIGGDSSGTLQSSVYYITINSDGTMASSWISTNALSTALMTWGGNFTTIWGAYIYISGGCSAVNGSGYCTTIASSVQFASINADGSIDEWKTVDGVSTSRISYGLVAWRNTLYEVGGCDTQDTSTGACTDVELDASYGTINQDGDIGINYTSVASGTSPCSGGSPTDCNLPSAVGNLLDTSTILNGYLYIVGGCTNDACTTESSGVIYTAISSDGSITEPASCPGGTSVDSYCSSNYTISGGIAAAGVAIFNGRIYIVGGFPSKNTIYYTAANSDGSLNPWNTASMSGIGATSVSYTFAYARANPSSAATSPGNLYIFGGCGSPTGVSCGSEQQAVYKCNIDTSGVPSACSTTNQLQIGTIPGASGTGLGAHAGTVYANYIYLIGGLAPGVNDLPTLRYAKFDNNNNVVAASGSAWVESPNHTSTGRRRGAAFGYNGYIYVAGGFDGTGGGGVLADVEFAKVNVSDGSVGTFSTSSVNADHRWGLDIAVSNSNAYVIGGCTDGDAPSSCDNRTSTVKPFIVFNNDSGAPASYADSANLFGTDRMGAGSTIMNGYIYVAGGCTGTSDCSTFTNTTQFASIDSNTGAIGSWSAGGNLPASVGWGKLVNAGGTLYYVGGQTGSANTTAVATIYYSSSISSGNPTWGTATNGIPAARTKMGVAVWNNRIYITGGYSTAGTVQSTVYESPSLSSGGNITASWPSATTSFNVARAGTTAITYANNIYILGGDDGTNYLNDVQYSQISSSDGSVGSWTYTTSLPSAISMGDGFASNGYMYLFGGRSSATICTNKTLVAPISANTTIASGNNPTGVGEWFETNSRFSTNRYGLGADLYNGKAYLTGGACNIFPSLSAPYSTVFSSASTTHNVSMPDVVNSGDLLLVFITTDGSTATPTATGFTSVSSQTGSTQLKATVFAKVAAGTEGGTTVNFSTGATSVEAAAMVYRIPTGQWSGALSGVEAAATDSGSTASPNPPSLDPTGWATENTLWIAYAAGSTYSGVTTYPTGFINGNHINTTVSTSGASVSTAWTQAAVSSEDPGAFTMANTQNGVAYTVAVRPPTSNQLTYTGSDRVMQTAILSQPQIAKYSRMIDLDSDARPTKWLVNGLDNGIGASWNLNYQSSTAANAAWGQNTNVGAITLGTPGTYTPLDGSGSNTTFARYYYLAVNIDASQTFGYPEDVSRGPTITDITLFFTADPSKRLRNGKTFVNGIQQPFDTPF